MKPIRKVEHREQRKARNKAVVEAMTDEELKEIKTMINAEQVRRIEESIKRLGYAGNNRD